MCCRVLADRNWMTLGVLLALLLGAQASTLFLPLQPNVASDAIARPWSDANNTWSGDGLFERLMMHGRDDVLLFF